MTKIHGSEADFEFLSQEADRATQFACAPSWLSDDDLALAVQKMGPTQRARLLDAIEAVRDEEEDEG